ncbi:MAG TPA: hypothetical protein PLR71_02915 [Deltaproteobacteria bacterium]|nr:hypothetical protein [Deltaproteobacteria bacterium]HQI80488.1 hypothetical protein [Deltaproteobacteria bacterium]
MIEKIPFLHRQRMYNIVIEEDITFTALHGILDDLIGQGAFEAAEDCGELYRVMHGDVHYTVGVDGIDVFISIK